MALLWVMAIGVAALATAVRVPRSARLSLALGFALLWWGTARMEELAFTRVTLETMVVPNAAVALAAVSDRRFRSGRIPRSMWMLLTVAVASVGFVHNVIDFEHSLRAQAGWVSTVAAAMTVMKCINGRDDVDRLVSGVARALVPYVWLCAAYPLLNPSAIGDAGGRLWAWGANPNSVGPVLALAAGSQIAASVTANARWRKVLLSSAALAGALIALTASRGNLLMLAFAVTPTLASVTRRRPLHAVVFAVAAVALVSIAIDFDDVRLDRLGNLQTDRAVTAEMYLDAVKERPFFGLLGSEGQSGHKLVDAELDDHNAYLRMAYLGGLALLLPAIWVAYRSLRCARRLVRRWRHERRVTAVFIAWTLLGMHLLGFTNRLMYEPLGVWPFMYALIAGVAMKAWKFPAVQPSRRVNRTAPAKSAT